MSPHLRITILGVDIFVAGKSEVVQPMDNVANVMSRTVPSHHILYMKNQLAMCLSQPICFVLVLPLDDSSRTNTRIMCNGTPQVGLRTCPCSRRAGLIPRIVRRIMRRPGLTGNRNPRMSITPRPHMTRRSSPAAYRFVRISPSELSATEMTGDSWE